jgi:hypothetical protein
MPSWHGEGKVFFFFLISVCLFCGQWFKLCHMLNSSYFKICGKELLRSVWVSILSCTCWVLKGRAKYPSVFASWQYVNREILLSPCSWTWFWTPQCVWNTWISEEIQSFWSSEWQLQTFVLISNITLFIVFYSMIIYILIDRAINES